MRHEARGRAFTLEPGLTLLEAVRRGFAAAGLAAAYECRIMCIMEITGRAVPKKATGAQLPPYDRDTMRA